MKINFLFGLFLRLVVSIIFAGVFYVGWMAVAIPILKTESINIVPKAVLWIAAPVVTAAGFAAGVFLFELLPGTRKSKFLDIYKWSFAGCAIGAVSVVCFGPMLIVFGMFALGTAAIAIREIIIRKQSKNTS